MIEELIDHIKEKGLETFVLVINLVYDTLLLIVALGCFKILDITLNYLGYESEISAKIVHYIHLIIILALGALSIDSIFIAPRSTKSSKPSTESKRVFELIQKNDIKHKVSNSSKNGANNNISNQSEISNLDKSFVEKGQSNPTDPESESIG